MGLRSYARTQYKRDSMSEVMAIAMTPNAKRAQNDLGIFGEYVAGKTPQAHHRQWFEAWVSGVDSQELKQIAGRDTNVLAPRGSAKSTWIALFVAWLIGHNPHAQIIYVGYSESVALKQSRMIKRIIESEKYQEVFPHIRPGKRWSDTDWEIDKIHAGVTTLDSDYTLYAVGITGAITSRRASVIVPDDVIKSSSDIATEEVRDKYLTNWQEVLLPTLIPGGRIFGIGTRFRRDDIHAVEFTPERGWVVLEQSAIVCDEDGVEDSYWRARFSLESLLELRERNPIVFSYQYQNKIPPQEDEQIIKAEWIKFVEELPANFSEIVIGVDLATSEKQKGDYTTFVVVGKVKSQYIVIEALERRIKGNVQKIQEILKIRDRYKRYCYRVRVRSERGAYQASIEGDWADYKAKHRVQNIYWDAVIAPGDKDQKLESISGVFEDGRVFLYKKNPMGRLVAQLLRNDLRHDDLADGLVLAIGQRLRRVRKQFSAA